jgi:hypothetical protein
VAARRRLEWLHVKIFELWGAKSENMQIHKPNICIKTERDGGREKKGGKMARSQKNNHAIQAGCRKIFMRPGR